MGVWMDTWNRLYSDQKVAAVKKEFRIPEDKVFSPLEDVSDQMVMDFSKKLAQLANTEFDELWKKTGKENIQSFFRWYPGYFKKPSLLSFLNAMDVVHKILTRRIKGANPPRVFFQLKTPTRATLRYQSKRDFRNYFLGLLEGASAHFKEPIELINPVLGNENGQFFVEVDIVAQKPYGTSVRLPLIKGFSFGFLKSFSSMVLVFLPVAAFLLGWLFTSIIHQPVISALATAGSIAGLIMLMLIDFRKASASFISGFSKMREKELDHPLTIKGISEFEQFSQVYNESAETLRHTVLGLSGDVQEVETFTAKIEDSATSIQSLIGTMSELSHQVAQSAVDISQDTESISEAVNSNVGTLREIINRETEMVRSLNEAVDSIIQSSKSVGQSADGIGKMSQSFDQLVNVGKDLQERAGKIMEIAGTVTSIAEQTNLLALNAAIEAARSGEAGRGFAVVADEIRKLAVESRGSADQISQFLGNISGGINQLIERLFSQFEEMKKQSQMLRSSSDQNRTSSENISNISQEINDLILKLQEEAEKLEGISSSIENLLAISEESSATAEEISASIQKFLEDIKNILGNITEISRFIGSLNENIQDVKM